ncbi:alpha/beta hydrolase, partial [Patescibacteria group bacterium]
AAYIKPLEINGLKGRMWSMPAPKGKKRNILFVYGHHSSIERCWGIMEELNQYGSVTMPDLPGFGGMDSLHKIGKEPTVDNLADYLASFIKLRYKRKNVTLVGFSFGFVVITRMLQRYPELTKRVELVISTVGFAHKDEFQFTPRRYQAYLWAARVFSRRIPAFLFRYLGLNSLAIKTVYRHTHNAKSKFAGLSREELKRMLDFEVHLWQCNDVRTYMRTSVEFLTLDNCQARIELPVWHVSVDADRYFDNRLVVEHLKVIYEKVNVAKAKLDSHAPSIIADRAAARGLVPYRIRNLLAS